jgi:hypothetical protein
MLTIVPAAARYIRHDPRCLKDEISTAQSQACVGGIATSRLQR